MPIVFPFLYMDAAALPAFAYGKANWVLRASSFARSRRNRFYFKKASSLSLLQPAGLYSTDLSDVLSSGLKQKAFGPVMAAKKSSVGSKEDVGRYKRTIDLPKTTFGMRANSVAREPEIQKLWEDNQVFNRAVERNTGGTFVLHDGPPYANGKLHMGHALNKILKDIINRYKLLRNYKIQFVPGWDCHGLPIELKGRGGRGRGGRGVAHLAISEESQTTTEMTGAELTELEELRQFKLQVESSKDKGQATQDLDNTTYFVSGASRHVTGASNEFALYYPNKHMHPETVQIADGTSQPIRGTGICVSSRRREQGGSLGLALGVMVFGT